MTFQRFKEHRFATVVGTGLATFFFGFGAGALFNWYLLASHSTTYGTLRTTLTFRSAIYGDGLILPFINMVAVAALLADESAISKKLAKWALGIGLAITAWFHYDQASHKLVNWAMPRPWHWNGLGLWHAIYMLSVASLLSLFFLATGAKMRQTHKIPIAFIVVTIGLLVFFILLGTDYR